MSGYGRALAGFVAGAADYGVDRIQAREKLDMELKKTKLLAELQKETEKEMAVFRDNLEKKGFNKELSSIDYTTGERIMRDGEGKEIGRTKLSKSDMEAYELDRRKAELDNQNVESTISSRGADDRRADEQLSLERARTGASIASSRASTDLTKRQIAALDGSGKGEGVISEIADGLRDNYKDSIETIVADGILPEKINMVSLNIAADSKKNGWSKELTEYNFQKALVNLRNQPRNRVNKRTNLDGTQ